MQIQENLASAQGRKDQGPNKQLAQEIVASEDFERLNELILFFDSKPSKDLQKDCALTLAWIAEERPCMLVCYADYLLEKLQDPINRVIWASMIALSAMSDLIADKLYDHLPKVINAMYAGTVVTRDYGFRILVTVYQNKIYQEDVFVLILEQISIAPPNHLGQYTERIIAVIESEHKKQLIKVLEERLGELVNAHHQKRLTKNLKKLYEL